MATTAAGNSYTPHVWTNVTGDQSVWAVADHLAGTTYRKPVLMYCHGNGGSFDAFTNGSQYDPLRDLLIDHGWAYVETLGGSASNWGREFAMASYAAAAREAAAMHPLGTLVILGRSMGGCVSSSLALNPEWGMKQHVVGLLLESAVQDMYFRHVTRGYSLNGQYPEGRVDKGGDPQEFAAAVEPFNPIQFPVEWYEDMPVQFVHGTHDDNVLPAGNAIPQYHRIKDTAPYADLYLRGLGTHGVSESADPEIVRPSWDFIRRAQGLYPYDVTLTDDGQVLDVHAVHYQPGWRQALPLTP